MSAIPNATNGNGKRRAILLVLAAIFLAGGIIWYLRPTPKVLLAPATR